MKQMILIATLIGLNAIGSYAQNDDNYKSDDNYICNEKVVHFDVVPIAQDVPTTGKYIYYNQDTAVQTFVPGSSLIPMESQACTRSYENNLLVTRCPGVTYKSDSTNVYEYGSDGTYMGFYPVKSSQKITCIKVEPTTAARHEVYKWTIPANANKECSPK